MASRKHESSRAGAPASTATAETLTGADAIDMLIADHRKVKELFAAFVEAKDEDEEKSAIVDEVCNELIVHTAIEEEIFYPAVRQAIDDSDLMDEALVEHAGAKDLIEQLQAMSPDEELYDAKVTVLGEQISHHVEEEEGTMFAKARKAQVDTAELGVQMQERRMALREELGMDDDHESQDDSDSETASDEGESGQARSAGAQGHVRTKPRAKPKRAARRAAR